MARKLLALDLFCGGGGACIGMQWAGFEVVGIDIKPHRNYPGHFIQADIHDLPVDIHDFAFVWASPPCQAFSVMKNMRKDKTLKERYPNLIPYVRNLLSTHPFTAIENVPKSPIRSDVVLAGGSFGMPYVHRKRCFELSFFMFHPPVPSGFLNPTLVRQGKAITITNGSTSKKQHYRRVDMGLPGMPTTENCKEAMGIPSEYIFNRKVIAEAIPPAYSEFIAREARQQIEMERQ